MRKAISFIDIMVENAEKRRMGIPYYAQKLDKKDIAYKFADSIGLRRPASDFQVYKFAEIEPQDGPVVIKPTTATGAMGIYLIFNRNTILSARNGVYFNSWSDLVKDVEKEKEKDKTRDKSYLKKDEWMIEELILGSEDATIPANDLKFFCFYGQVMFVLEINRAFPKQCCVWDIDMNKIRVGRFDDYNDMNGQGFTKEELDYIISISLQIPAPFIRLDMLKSHKGLVFCEATYYPGRYELYNERYSRKMGVAYREAEARILKDLLNGKKFETFTSLIKV